MRVFNEGLRSLASRPPEESLSTRQTSLDRAVGRDFLSHTKPQPTRGKEADGSRERWTHHHNRPREKIWTVETQGTHNAAKEVLEQSNKYASDLAEGGRWATPKQIRRAMERSLQGTARI